MQLTAVLIPAEKGGFVALNPETGTSTQGESIEEALANLLQLSTSLEELLQILSVTLFQQSLLECALRRQNQHNLRDDDGSQLDSVARFTGELWGKQKRRPSLSAGGGKLCFA